jgi:hypothetical protein
LSILADCARAAGDLDAAACHVAEALSITGPRDLRPANAAALAARARTYADQVAAGSREQLPRGRDAADAALRIATRRGLAWQELDALDAHVHLDQAEGVDHDWAQQAAGLRARLIPGGLDPDPLRTVKRQVAEEKASSRCWRTSTPPAGSPPLLEGVDRLADGLDEHRERRVALQHALLDDRVSARLRQPL